MGQQITPFLFEGEHMVRVIEKVNGPHFVAKDACMVLHIANVSMAVDKLDEDEKGISSIDTLGGKQDVITVTEGGLYTLILRSRHATTPGTIQHRFRKWVTGDVLPAIRKTGSYAVAGEVISPEVLEARAFPDWPLEEMRTKRSVVDMYRLTFGNQAAQWVCPKLGFPIPPLDLIEHGRQMSLTLVHSQEAAE